MTRPTDIVVEGAREHNLKGFEVAIERGAITVVTGVSGSGKSSLAFDTVLAEAQRRFFYTLSHYSRQFLDLGSRPKVTKVSGLSPAISLAQNETQPSKRATVGTLTDISELLGVLFARFGEAYCPTHDEPTKSLSPAEIVANIMDQAHGEVVAICAPVATAKKGIFKAQLTAFAQKGFLKAFIDGEIVGLSPVPKLEKEEKHTIKIIIDHVKVKAGAEARLTRSVLAALQAGEGFGEYFVAEKGGHFSAETAPGSAFSTKGGCPLCGYSWPKLDSRYFNPNSLGQCQTCRGYGELDVAEEEVVSEEDDSEFELVHQCRDCRGIGIDARYWAIKVRKRSIFDYQTSAISSLQECLADQELQSLFRQNKALARVGEEIQGKLKRIEEVGLGYLCLSRRVRSLSGGEAQRLKLAGLLTESLRGVLYVLDEPSQGLHPSEMDALLQTLSHLRDLGNTLLIVDHDELVMRRADWIIDLGPGGGAQGGQLMAKFRPTDAEQHRRTSRTASQLVTQQERRAAASSKSKRGEGDIEVVAPHLHNLKINKVHLKKGQINVVTGVSGAGKSSLVMGVLYPNVAIRLGKIAAPKPGKKPLWCEKISGLEDIDSATLIDRRPIAKSSVSMPASYLDVFTDLRNLYASLPAAQIAGLTARSFSLSVDAGRCKECKGKGEITLSMRFLADARVKCPVCLGARYELNVLEIIYNGLSMADVLQLTIEEAVTHFQHQRRIVDRLRPALALGLGYLKLGQPSASLSGGEAQRLKLVPYLTRKQKQGSLLLLDEPTTGLHFEDVNRLMAQLSLIVEGGATVVMIEHNSDVILASDWVVDLGPGPADAGGELVYEGPPSGLSKVKSSVTGKYLL